MALNGGMGNMALILYNIPMQKKHRPLVKTYTVC